MVMLSTFGAIVIASFTAARGPFVAAREGMFPKILAMINIEKKSPSPSVLFTAAITIFLIIVGNFTLLSKFFIVRMILKYYLSQYLQLHNVDFPYSDVRYLLGPQIY